MQLLFFVINIINYRYGDMVYGENTRPNIP